MTILGGKMIPKFKIEFHGVRGSVPAPLTAKDLDEKFDKLYQTHFHNGGVERFADFLKRQKPLTYGGNTSCVSIRYDDVIIVCDAGTGLRSFGGSLMPEMFANKGVKVNFFLSHVHWDHIQGLPFFAPLYMNKHETGILNEFNFHGGVDWQGAAQECIQGQMDAPNFPVTWAEIAAMTEKITFNSLVHGKNIRLPRGLNVRVGKLNHPQETYGFRFESANGQVVVYTTDHEPWNPQYPDPRLLSLIKDADIWITDCQYTQNQYEGIEGGVPRHGWGHSYPEVIAAAADMGKVKTTVLFHHDPASSDERIKQVEKITSDLIRSNGYQATPGLVIAAYEGLVLEI